MCVDISSYMQSGLDKDPLVLKLHKAIEDKDQQEIDRLSHLVVARRKPARLWPELNGLFAALQIEVSADGQTMCKPLTYSRYSEGNDFTQEQEARIVTTEANRDVYFNESEVLAVITPDQATQEMVRTSLERSWSAVPKVMVFPT